MVVALNPEQQRKLVHQITRLPQTPDSMYNALQLDVPYIGYICCPRCFALYDADTWRPIKRPSDHTSQLPIPPLIPYPENRPGT